MINFTRRGRGFLISLSNNQEKLYVKNLVLATGGQGGKYERTNNFRYSLYNIFDLVKNNGGQTKNLDCVFRHPFGFREGRRILIGIESMKGEFVNSRNEYIFDDRLRNLIKENNYHESMPEILEKTEIIRKKGETVYFIDSKRKLEIVPTLHYTGGGISADKFGEVLGVKNLFVIGECRADGYKRGGRLPGYAFTSAIVDGKMLADRFSEKS